MLIASSLDRMGSRAEIDPVTRARIAAWLRHYRDTRKWTHQKLADTLGLSEPTVTNIMNEKRTPGLDVLIKMHTKLHRSADEILDDDPPPSKPAKP